jgi:hypothetical protein
LRKSYYESENPYGPPSLFSAECLTAAVTATLVSLQAELNDTFEFSPSSILQIATIA